MSESSKNKTDTRPGEDKTPPRINPPSGEVSTSPDEYTKRSNIFIPDGAPNQVFRFERWGVCYGTDDKGHAAAVILSVILLVLLIVLFIGGFFVDRSWIPEAIQIVGSAFTFVAGVAIGQGLGKKD